LPKPAFSEALSVPTAVLLRTARSHPAVIEFAVGSGATATLSRVGDDVLELAVDEYVTQKRHAIATHRWLLRPIDAACTGWRITRRLPAT
jgi:hypothetical protein